MDSSKFFSRKVGDNIDLHVAGCVAVHDAVARAVWVSVSEFANSEDVVAVQILDVHSEGEFANDLAHGKNHGVGDVVGRVAASIEATKEYHADGAAVVVAVANGLSVKVPAFKHGAVAADHHVVADICPVVG